MWMFGSGSSFNPVFPSHNFSGLGGKIFVDKKYKFPISEVEINQVSLANFRLLLPGVPGYVRDPWSGFELDQYDETFKPPRWFKTPHDYPEESIAALENNTYRIEFEVPAGDGELPHPWTGVTHETIKLRGWYIKGMRNHNDSPALMIMLQGSGGQFHLPHPYRAGWREAAYHFALAGYDVLLYDQRGCGVSEGITFWSAVMESDDVIRIIHNLATGEGVKVIGPGETAPRNIDGGELLEGYSASEIPVILNGYSWGSMVATHVMSKHILAKYDGQISGLTFAEYFPDDLEDKSYYANLNIKAVIGDNVIPMWNRMVDNLSWVMAMTWEIASDRISYDDFLPYGKSHAIQTTQKRMYDSTILYATLPYWPAHLNVCGAVDDLHAVLGCIDAYNLERGLKNVLVHGSKHSDWIWSSALGVQIPELFRYVVAQSIKFADRALYFNGRLNNTKQTTLQKEVCEASRFDMLFPKGANPIPGEQRWLWGDMLPDDEVE